MPAKLIKDEYKYYDIIYSDTFECGVDMEYYLPDYCPDIQKILKCCAVPQLESVSAAGDRLTISGNLNVTVLYCDDKAAAVRSCEFNKEFTAAAKLPQTTASAVAEVIPHCGHMVCRAVNARKLDVHIPVFFDSNVFSVSSDTFTKDIENAEKLTESVSISEAILNCSRELSFTHDFELAETAPPIESVFRKDVKISKITYTAEDNAITVSGDINFSICYRSYDDNSVYEKMKYTIPFSEIIPCDGVSSDPGQIWNVELIPTNYSVQLKEDSVGEYTRISLYLKATAYIRGYRNTEIHVVKDCYTTDCIGKEKYNKQSFRCYENKGLAAEIIKTISLENCERVLDLWCSDFTVASFSEPGKINYRGSFSVNTLYIGKDHRLSSAVKLCDFTIPAELADAFQRKASAAGNVEITDFRLLNESEIEFRADISVLAFIVVRKTADQLIDEEYISELPEHSGNRLIVCYDSGQSLWELGKKHRIPLETIRAVNDICDDADCKYPLILFR